ncbi:hypothetical protein DFH06DRAFT_1395194 [Mycena polygramma]|nr:hypothetical protein DFH06DRAFT_1395194 [Mycena polygramma]
MLVNNVLFTLALFAASSIAAQPQDKCTPIQDISALESLSGWSEMEQWLTDNQLQNPTIGKGKGKYTSVTACVGSGPFEITPGTPRCLTERRQTATKNTTASGLVWFNTAPGFSTSADMTISKNAAFAPDASSTVDLSLPSLGGHGAPVLASVAVINAAGEKQGVPFTAAAGSSGGVVNATLYAGPNAQCGVRYLISSCTAPATARIPFVATGWIFAKSISGNETVRVSLEVIQPEGRSSYMELTGQMALHSAGFYYNAFCNGD